jgi:hypothetical protein
LTLYMSYMGKRHEAYTPQIHVNVAT